MILSAIVAVSNNNAIGIDNNLPWHMPADLKFFKETTKGYYVLMGRKSFDSVGRPLPGRTNIVITRNKDFYHSGVHTFNSIPDGIKKAQDDKQDKLFILGGSNIYDQTKYLWDELFITNIDVDIPNATAFFPKVNFSEYDLINEEKNLADEKNPHDYTFCQYKRKFSK